MIGTNRHCPTCGCPRVALKDVSGSEECRAAEMLALLRRIADSCPICFGGRVHRVGCELNAILDGIGQDGPATGIAQKPDFATCFCGDGHPHREHGNTALPKNRIQ